MDLHEVVVKLKEWVAENGRAPTRPEFSSLVPGLHGALARRTITWNDLLHAAGIPSYDERRRRGEGSGKLTNAIFERPIAEVLAEKPEPLPPPPAVLVPSAPIEPTLILPDTHFPWVNQRVIDAAYAWLQKYGAARVVQVGDLYDMYAHAKFPRSHNIYRPEEEERLAREGAEKMWAEVRRLVPNAECVQLKGNHDIRPLKRTLEALPSLEHVVAHYLDKLMTFEGVKLISDPRQEYLVGNVEFIHGYRSKLGEHRDYALMNAVCGHIHVGGVVFRRIRGQTLWELNCGLAGDPEAKALSYTAQRITNWTPGFGYIDEHGPRFVPV